MLTSGASVCADDTTQLNTAHTPAMASVAAYV